jgi:hypothetical protein
MARLSRITVPDHPHHVKQRGNLRQALFLGDEDYAVYRDLMAERCKANGVAGRPIVLRRCVNLAFNPVRAGLAQQPADWMWSSVGAHLRKRDDALVAVKPLLALAPDPQELFTMSLDEASSLFDLETKSVTGRPLGDDTFLADLVEALGYPVRPRKRGPKARGE